MPVLADGGRRRPAFGLDTAQLTPAAVLVLLVPDPAGNAAVVLIERPTYDGHHSGEVSFPGGKAEPGDTDAVSTALREAAEEVGLDPDGAGVEILGTLDEVIIPVSGFRITPVVGAVRRHPSLVPSAAEVARIVEAPLESFIGEADIRIVERTIRDWDLRFGIYPVAGLQVWGATARMLGQLGALFEGVTDSADVDAG